MFVCKPLTCFEKASMLLTHDDSTITLFAITSLEGTDCVFCYVSDLI
jgi:hypothetical protein